jgi:hypothetical protein
MSDLARVQALLARFLADPVFEARLRASPLDVAREQGVDVQQTERIAQLAPERVEAFRRSRRHKQEVRAGKSPERL